jgi:hypothetical protein
MRQPFRLLVTGSRTWTDTRTIEQALAMILDRHPEGVLLVYGACPRGADAMAAAYATRTPGYQIEKHPADWRWYGRAAGYRRNARDDRPRRRRLRRVHPSRQPRQHQRRPAGHSSGHTRLAPHTALTDATGYGGMPGLKSRRSPCH